MKFPAPGGWAQQSGQSVPVDRDSASHLSTTTLSLKIMNITVEKQPNCLASLQVEVPAEARTKEENAILANYTRYASLPGFRKGKAPRNVVAKKFSAEIKKELAERLMKLAVDTAQTEHKLSVLGVRNFNQVSEGSFHLEVITTPEFDLPDYKGLPITVPALEVTEDTILEVLKGQQERLADIKEVEGRPVQLGDYLTVSYTATLNGEPLKAQIPENESFIAENDSYLLKADEDAFLPGFCIQLVGMKEGETKDISVTMPEDFQSAVVSGKEVTYSVSLNNIKEPILPELSDAFADRVATGKTLEELKEIIRGNLANQATQKDLEQKRIAAMLALREKVTFDLPEHVVVNATQQRINQLVQMNTSRGIAREVINSNQQAIIEAASSQAKVDVKDEFILLRVIEAEKLEATQQDIIQRLSIIAQQANSTFDQVLQTFRKEDRFNEIRHSILLGKALDVLVEHAQVTVDGSVDALTALNQPTA